MPRRLHDVAVATAVASVVSGAPSTAHALATGRGVLDGARAAGTLVPGRIDRPGLIAGGVVHLVVSAFWGAVLGILLPRRHTQAWGAVTGLAIAAISLLTIGRRRPAMADCRNCPNGRTTSRSARSSAGYSPALMLRLPERAYLEMVGHAFDGYPIEACGLFAGVGERVAVFYPCANAAASAKVYEVDGRDYLRADRDAESRGLELLGVMHSHTHTDSYPSPTDIVQAPDCGWHYVIVSLREAEPVLRSFRISIDGEVSEEPVVVERRPTGTIPD